MNWSMIASALMALAVALGAFGAHGLKGRLDAHAMDLWEKAAFYHFIHALGLLAVSLETRLADAGLVCWLLFAGILLFSGSLYILALTGMTALGAVTPFGGTAFIAAWLALAYRLSQ